MKTKIEVAIYDIKLKIKKAEQDIMLLLREKETLVQQLDCLEVIDKTKNLT